MKRASQRFTKEEKEKVGAAVAQAEAKTSAEIVPAVATDSGRYDRPEDTVGLWFGIAALVVAWAALPPMEAEAGSWGGPPPVLEIVILAAAVLAGFLLGAVLGARIGWLRHLFTPRRQMHEEVDRRARQIFFDNRVHRTKGATGILLYVSLFERMASVIADETTTEKLGQPVLEALCAKLTEDLGTLAPAEALCASVALAGEKLAEVLPAEAGDVNELPDALVILD
jgi:putative membrane protein